MDPQPTPQQLEMDALRKSYQAMELELRETYEKEELISEQKRRKAALKKQKELQLENAKLRQVIDKLDPTYGAQNALSLHGEEGSTTPSIKKKIPKSSSNIATAGSAGKKLKSSGSNSPALMGSANSSDNEASESLGPLSQMSSSPRYSPPTPSFATMRAQSSPNVFANSGNGKGDGGGVLIPTESGAGPTDPGSSSLSNSLPNNSSLANLSSSPSDGVSTGTGGLGQGSGGTTTWKRVRMTNPNDRGIQGSVSSGAGAANGTYAAPGTSPTTPLGMLAMGDRASLMLSSPGGVGGSRPAGSPPSAPLPAPLSTTATVAGIETLPARPQSAYAGIGSGRPRPPSAMLSTTTNTTSGGATQQSQSLSDALNLLYVAIAKGDLSAVEVSEDNDIAFLADGQLRAATLEKLIYLLPCNSDPYYLLHFLITFRSFCSPEELLRKLVDVWDNSAFASYTSRELDVFRIKYMNVVKTWLDKHFYDFTPQLVHNVTEFLDKHHEAIGPVTCHSMKKLIKRNTDRIEKKVVYSVVPSSAPILPPDFAACELGPLALDPLELARQMTLLDEQQYKSILPRECMNQCWNKGTQADQQERAPHVVRMILRFNAVSAWVTRCIVSEPLVKKRKTILTRMIKLAQHLRQIHNYHSLLAVVAALESASVTRLKKTWEAVDKSYLQQLQDLKALMSAEGSYKSFRAALHSEDPPCIPYLGVYLADLTFIEDGNPDRVPSADDSGRELINFAKMRMLAKVIDEIRFYQQDPFAFEPVPRIQEYLQNEELSPISEKDAYELSLKAEPRPPVK